MISRLEIKDDLKTLEIASTAFTHRNYIPKKYTCDGENVNPPLTIHNLPRETKSLVIIVEDPITPVHTWTHWVVWNIPPVKAIKEDSVPGTQGLTDFNEYKYEGPCPPSGLHYYHYKVYALDALLELKSETTRHELEKKMSSHLLAFGEIIGLYKRDERVKNVDL
jgi:Raf kinase inhibitor-like YbhB/YbcL family protein